MSDKPADLLDASKFEKFSEAITGDEANLAIEHGKLFH